jgi:hypothetical protein
MHKPKDLAVLNVIQALAADVVLSGGDFKLNDGSEDILEPIKLTDGISYNKTPYALGTPSIKDVDFAAGPLLAYSQYRLAVEIPGRIDFNGGGQEANQLIAIKEYIVWTGVTAPTATSLATDFVAQINLYGESDVTASLNGAELRLTLNDVAEGDFFPSVESGATITDITPYVAPSGTPAIVEALAPTQSSPTAEYTTYQIDYKQYYKHNGVGGMEARKDAYVLIFADENATNFAAFELELLAVLGGSHTPVSDYLGI